VPSPELIEGEKELMSIKAGLMEIGPIGFVMRQKENIILTNKRVFQYSSRLGSAYLRTMYLKQVESVTIGGQLNFYFLAVAVVSFLLIFSNDTPFFGKILLLIITAVFVIISRKKVISVSSGDRKDSIMLPLKHIKKEESQKFIDLISKYILK